ncbi:outer membrane protein assembly factor [Deinococcus lacus]|uniref:Outer membrane protein assembly factor n=1 Tax=Deinococcus lacus TaxID=392561 RepID=A0ABW1YA11_9DEIO
MQTRTLFLTLSLTLVPAASAQGTVPAAVSPAGTVQDVVVTGTTELLANFVRATLSVQPGAQLSTLSPEAVRQEVLASGYFSAATVTVGKSSGRDALLISVVPNAVIGRVDVTGMTFLPAEGFKNSVAELLNIAAGATLNTARLQQASQALVENYRAEGFPFDPAVRTETVAASDGTVTVRFLVDETAPIRTIRVDGVTLLPRDQVEALFRPLFEAKRFTPEGYYRAVAGVEQLYAQKGYLNAGIDPRTTTLVDGVLSIRAIEGKVMGVDLSNLGNPVATLQTRAGQPLTVAQLQADVRTLANQTGKPVGFALQANPANPAEVMVYFGAADVVTAPVKSIQVTGNTVVPTEELLAAVKTKPGDIYSPQLAQNDFGALRDLYRQRGYEISTRDAITFENGVLAFNIREVQLAGYQLKWQGERNTEDRVILRELPQAGGAFNVTKLREALGNISRLGYVRIVDVQTVSDPEKPESLTYVLTVTESNDAIPPLGLSLGYESARGGWNGDVSYENPNVFGKGHNLGVKLGAQQNDAGQNWFGNVSYTVPWLDLDFLDFREKRTTLTLGLGSNVVGNRTLVFDEGTAFAGADTGREYTERETSFGVELGRNLTDKIFANVGVSVGKSDYYIEEIKDGDVRMPLRTEGGTEVWKTCTGEDRTLTIPGAGATPEQVTAYNDLRRQYSAPCSVGQVAGVMPESQFTTRIGAAVRYNDANSAEFPTSGVRADVRGGYSVGKAGDESLGWFDVEGGARTYFGLGSVTENEDGTPGSHRQVIALRANAGTSVGKMLNGGGYAVGGGEVGDFGRQIRGIGNGELFGTSYLTTSAEYRYDFGLKTAFTTGVYGVLFADAGTAWSQSEQMKFKYGLGAGVQLNTPIVPIRFDYGYNPENGKWSPYFRIGGLW